MNKLIIKHFKGLQAYAPILEAMQQMTQQRIAHSAAHQDQLWLLEHEAVFTQGQAGKPEHILNPHAIPVIHSDRGGQVTYHGPGQLMIYTIFDLNAANINTREFVRRLEQCIIDYLKTLEINAENKCDAPGVYIKGAKICSIGLRVRRGFSYHGLAFNIDMDMFPFQYINPCGFESLEMTQLNNFTKVSLTQVIHDLIPIFKTNFDYHHSEFTVQ